MIKLITKNTKSRCVNCRKHSKNKMLILVTYAKYTYICDKCTEKLKNILNEININENNYGINLDKTNEPIDKKDLISELLNE